MNATTAANESQQATYDPATEYDKYEYLDGEGDHGKPGWFKRLLWWCAGADAKLLVKCPRYDHVKQECVGGTVLSTAILAFFSGSYALYTVFAPRTEFALSAAHQQLDTTTLIIAVIFGLDWSATILNLDRFVVSSTGHGDGTDEIKGEEVKKALPRIALAAIIGICLSAPIEIRLMKTEIESELQIAQKEYADKFNKDAEKTYEEAKSDIAKRREEEVASLSAKDAEIEKKRQEVMEQEKIVQREAAGESANRKYGKGPGYEAKKEALERIRQSFQAAEKRFESERVQLQKDIAKADQELVEAKEMRAKKIQEYKETADKMDGLIYRIVLAHKMYPWSSGFLMALLMIVEIVPIFFKMMLTTSPYDFLVENQMRLTIAKYAIEASDHPKPGTAARIELQKTYHQAETIQEFQVGQLQVEQTLTKVAQETFSDQVQGDIRTNPGKYMAPSEPKRS